MRKIVFDRSLDIVGTASVINDLFGAVSYVSAPFLDCAEIKKEGSVDRVFTELCMSGGVCIAEYDYIYDPNCVYDGAFPEYLLTKSERTSAYNMLRLNALKKLSRNPSFVKTAPIVVPESHGTLRIDDLSVIYMIGSYCVSDLASYVSSYGSKNYQYVWFPHVCESERLKDENKFKEHFYELIFDPSAADAVRMSYIGRMKKAVGSFNISI